MNNAIFLFFYNFAFRSTVLDNLIIFFAVYLPYITVVLVGLFVLWHCYKFFEKNFAEGIYRTWKMILPVLVSGGLAYIIGKILKTLFQIPRPFSVLPNVIPLFHKTSFSFPSEHAVFFSAIAFSVFFINKKVGCFFMVLVLVIGIARVVAGVHFPFDILGGFIIGALVAYFVSKLNFSNK